MIARRRFLLLLAAPLCISLVGCGGSKATVPVSGVVTLDGAPLPNAQVTFNPVGGNGKMAIGTTDSQGRFQLTTYRPNDGALPGEYLITIALGLSSQPADENLAKDMKAMFQERDRLSKMKVPDVHQNYKSVAQTPLRQHIPADGEVKIALKKSGS